MIRANFSVDDLLRGKIDRMVKAIINTFIYVGEKCIYEARNNGSYIDRTGNLRSSIGYVVLYNGIVQGRESITSKNQKLIEELISKYRDGIVLIVVAGMSYAAYVEAKNYNVLTSSELLAEKLIPGLLKKIGFK